MSSSSCFRLSATVFRAPQAHSGSRSTTEGAPWRSYPASDYGRPTEGPEPARGLPPPPRLSGDRSSAIDASGSADVPLLRSACLLFRLSASLKGAETCLNLELHFQQKSRVCQRRCDKNLRHSQILDAHFSTKNSNNKQETLFWSDNVIGLVYALAFQFIFQKLFISSPALTGISYGGT